MLRRIFPSRQIVLETSLPWSAIRERLGAAASVDDEALVYGQEVGLAERLLREEWEGRPAFDE